MRCLIFARPLAGQDVAGIQAEGLHAEKRLRRREVIAELVIAQAGVGDPSAFSELGLGQSLCKSLFPEPRTNIYPGRH